MIGVAVHRLLVGDGVAGLELVQRARLRTLEDTAEFLNIVLADLVIVHARALAGSTPK